MPDDKKKQAMSLLFGDAPSRPTSPPKPETPREAPIEKSVAKTTSRSKAPQPSPEVPASKQPAKRKVSSAAKGGGESAAPDTQGTPDPYYQGASRYRRQSGEQVKHSVYLDPDVSQAIKVAAAMGDDPRGTNVSAIVNQALRDGGYGQ